MGIPHRVVAATHFACLGPWSLSLDTDSLLFPFCSHLSTALFSFTNSPSSTVPNGLTTLSRTASGLISAC